MNLSKTFTESFDVLKLRRGAIEEALEAPLSPALFVLALMALASALGYLFFPVEPMEGLSYRPDFFWILGRMLASFFFYFFSFGLIGVLAEQLFRSKVPAMDFLSLMCRASLAGVLLIVPVLFPAVVLWWFFIMHEALTKVGQVKTGWVFVLIALQMGFSFLIGYSFFPFS